MATVTEVFGDALQPDPDYALPAIQIPVRKRTGPMPRLQFVTEFVGPRSIPANAAAALLSVEWSAALGNPQSFAMSTADVEWRPLTASTAGSYDSLALAWDLLSPGGQLSQASAAHLLRIAERFAQQIQRRAMPMPVPEDVPKAITQLRQVKDNFDAGVSLLVLPNAHRVSEYECWVWCAKLGLTPNLSDGTFDWMVPSSALSVFSASPLGESESFDLEAARRGDACEGLLLGFSVPRSPEPMAGLESMFKAGAILAEKMWGQVYDENNLPLNDKSKQTMRTQLASAVEAMNRLGFAPGSPECLTLFRD